MEEGKWLEKGRLNLFKTIVQSWKKKTAGGQSSLVMPSAFQDITSQQLLSIPDCPRLPLIYNLQALNAGENPW